jgi:Asparagine synthase
MQFWYLKTFLHWLLMDNDRCSMAHSLEGRFPFLNKRVYELAFQIPPSVQIGGRYGAEKLLLRRAFKDALPPSIYRRAKAPLPSPLLIQYHKAIVGALEVAIPAMPKDFWNVLDKGTIEALLGRFKARVLASPVESDSLTAYLRLSDPWKLRTPQMFGVLTLLRWWKMNFT